MTSLAAFSAPRGPARVAGARWLAGALLLFALALAAGLLRFARPAPSGGINSQARAFVTLALQLGRIDGDEVDGYFGPPALRPAAETPPPTLATLRGDLTGLGAQVDATTARGARLAARIANLVALIDIRRAPRTLPFDEEARRLYGIDAAGVDAARQHRAMARLDALLPGSGSLTSRVEAYRQRYVVPEGVRQAMFAQTLRECRRRTLGHWPLPAAERMTVEWTRDVPSAWHRYDGGFRSTLRINPQAVAFIGSMIDLACHEGYPGHHAQFVLQEQAAGTGGLPVEERVVLLRSADSMFREGAASYAVDLAFPPAGRLAFERDVLFPMAGFARADAARFGEVRALIDTLSSATVPILRDYRDGRIDAEAAVAALERDALVSSPRPLLGFVDTLGAYVLGYTVARDWVGGRVERAAAAGDRWAVLAAAVANVAPPPRTPPLSKASS